MTNRTYDGGGQPAGYWALPFEDRWKYHAQPGCTYRNVSLVGTEESVTKLRNSRGGVPIHPVTIDRPSQPICEACGGIVAVPDDDHRDGRPRRFCSDACKQLAHRRRRATGPGNSHLKLVHKPVTPASGRGVEK